MRQQIKRSGGDVSTLPEPIQLKEYDRFYIDAFVDLCTTRNVGMSFPPISVLAVDDYCRNRNYDEFTTYFIHRVVRELDPILMKKVKDDNKANKVRK